MSSAIRTKILEVNAVQLSLLGAPTDTGVLLRVIDLPQKPLFQWIGSMWMPIAGVIVLAQSALAVNGAADTNENVLLTVNIPGGLLGPNGYFRLTTTWTLTNSANTKTARLRYSGAAGAQLHAGNYGSAAGALIIQGFANRGLANSQIGLGAQSGGIFVLAAGTAPLASAVDTSVATTAVLSMQKGSAGEIATLDSYLAEAFPAP